MGQIILNNAQLLEEPGIVENTLRALIEQRGFSPPRKMGRSCLGWWRRWHGFETAPSPEWPGCSHVKARLATYFEKAMFVYSKVLTVRGEDSRRSGRNLPALGMNTCSDKASLCGFCCPVCTHFAMRFAPTDLR